MAKGPAHSQFATPGAPAPNPAVGGHIVRSKAQNCKIVGLSPRWPKPQHLPLPAETDLTLQICGVAGRFLLVPSSFTACRGSASCSGSCERIADEAGGGTGAACNRSSCVSHDGQHQGGGRVCMRRPADC
jgi:hypothetical protein